MADGQPAEGPGRTPTQTTAPTPTLSQSSSQTPAQPTSTGTFVFPQYYHFPPMFTLQPNLATRRAQMDKWSALVLAYCRHYRIFRLALGGTAPAGYTGGPVRVGEARAADDGVDDGPRSTAFMAPDLLRNRVLDRGLSPASSRQVVEAMRQEGRAEWVDGALGAGSGAGSGSGSGADADPSATSAYIYWNTPDEWAAIIEAHIDDTAQRGSVLTLYELTAGDAARGTALHGLDPVILQRALAVLVKRGKAQVFGQAESLGVKFF